MEILTDVTRVIDLSFLGRPHVIATAVVETPAGIVLVDPGPSTCLDRLHQSWQPRASCRATFTPCC